LTSSRIVFRIYSSCLASISRGYDCASGMTVFAVQRKRVGLAGHSLPKSHLPSEDCLSTPAKFARMIQQVTNPRSLGSLFAWAEEVASSTRIISLRLLSSKLNPTRATTAQIWLIRADVKSTRCHCAPINFKSVALHAFELCCPNHQSMSPRRRASALAASRRALSAVDWTGPQEGAVKESATSANILRLQLIYRAGNHCAEWSVQFFDHTGLRQCKRHAGTRDVLRRATQLICRRGGDHLTRC
jgi:hypothetical protein